LTDFRIDKSDGNLLLLLARMLEDNLVVWMILSLESIVYPWTWTWS